MKESDNNKKPIHAFTEVMKTRLEEQNKETIMKGVLAV